MVPRQVFQTPMEPRNTLSLSSRAFVTKNGNLLSSNDVSDRLGNPDLKAETLSE